jgi:hypothetical protein
MWKEEIGRILWTSYLVLKKLNLVAIYVSWCAIEKGGKKKCDLGVRKA